MDPNKGVDRRSGSSPLRSTVKTILLALTFLLMLVFSRPVLSTTYNFTGGGGGGGGPTTLNGWVGAVINFMFGSNLQVALPFLHNPVNVLTGTYSGCAAGSGSGCVKGNGRTGTDGTWSSGTTFTAASGSFTSGDTGHTIWITERNLDTIGTQFSGTVTFVNSTTLTLSSTPGFSGSMTNADWVLGVDDGTNLLNASNSGDLIIPAGTYITGTSIKFTSDHHNIQCEDGAILLDPWHANSPHDIQAVQFNSNYNSIVGCTFQGTNVPIDSSHAAGYDANAEFNYLLFIGFSKNGNLVEGNHFSYGWGQLRVDAGGDDDSWL
jgi:hypothetical protein